MSREGEPPTTLPAGDFEPLRPPEPVPALPLPEELGGDNDGGDNDGGDNDGGDNDGGDNDGGDNDGGDNDGGDNDGGDTDQRIWPDQDWYGPDSEFDAADDRIAGDERPSPARSGWGEHAQRADSLPVCKPEQSWEAAQARLEQEWSATATSGPAAGSSGAGTSAVSPLRSPIVHPSTVDTNAAGTNGVGTNGGARAEPGTDEYRHGDEPGEHGPSGRRGDEPDAQRAGGSVGRHVRRPTEPAPSVVPTPPRLDYIPRHAVDVSGEFATVSATDVTEILARVREDPTEAPRKGRPEPERRFEQPPPAPVVAEPEPAPLPPGKRVKVVLSQRKGQARSVRTVVDVQELTQVGEVLSSSLIRSQLGLSLRIAAIALLGLGSLPAMFFYVPRLAALQLFGVRLPWLLLGAAVYPVLVFLGWFYSHCAENLEKIFAEDIQS